MYRIYTIRWKDDYERVKKREHHFCQLCERLNVATDKRNQIDPKLYQAEEFALPQKKKLGIKTPNANLTGTMEVNGWQKRYLNMRKWIAKGMCITPAGDHILNKFIRGTGLTFNNAYSIHTFVPKDQVFYFVLIIALKTLFSYLIF